MEIVLVALRKLHEYFSGFLRFLKSVVKLQSTAVGLHLQLLSCQIRRREKYIHVCISPGMGAVEYDGKISLLV